MLARIFRPAKNAMQSGKGHSDGWVLEFEQETARRIDPLMGWTGATDMTSGQVRLQFASKDEAVAYCQQHGIAHQVQPEHARKPASRSYAANFSHNRRKPWTH